MPVVINEIEVSVEVIHDQPTGTTGGMVNSTVKEEIIKQCVEQIMEILKQKNER